MKIISFKFLLLTIATSFCMHAHTELVDLEKYRQSFVLETKQLHIPGYEDAYNPSVIPFKDKWLLSFRINPEHKKTFNSEIGLVFVDEQFNLISKPQILKTNILNPFVPSRAEDARLIAVKNKIYMIYSNNKDEKISAGGFRVFISEVIFNGKNFHLENTNCLSHFPDNNLRIREKNWSPFIYDDQLLLIYSITPHRILRPLLDGKTCEFFTESNEIPNWKYGTLRGGTPALPINNQYLSFFHSSLKMNSIHSEGKESLHYFMGAYTFENEPPFAITSISKEPIIGPNFYHGKKYTPYWHPIQAVFPGGFTMNDKYIWVVYGRQDHEAWVVKLNKQALLKSLKPL